jgi:hypothetical protein
MSCKHIIGETTCHAQDLWLWSDSVRHKKQNANPPALRGFEEASDHNNHSSEAALPKHINAKILSSSLDV